MFNNINKDLHGVRFLSWDDDEFGCLLTYVSMEGNGVILTKKQFDEVACEFFSICGNRLKYERFNKFAYEKIDDKYHMKNYTLELKASQIDY